MTQQPFDLVIRNGTIVTPGHREQADVGIAGGRIARIGGAMTGAGEIDAGGLLAIPGGIGAHVHLVSARLAAQLAVAEPGEPVWASGCAAPRRQGRIHGPDRRARWPSSLPRRWPRRPGRAGEV